MWCRSSRLNLRKKENIFPKMFKTTALTESQCCIHEPLADTENTKPTESDLSKYNFYCAAKLSTLYCSLDYILYQKTLNCSFKCAAQQVSISALGLIMQQGLKKFYFSDLFPYFHIGLLVCRTVAAQKQTVWTADGYIRLQH